MTDVRITGTVKFFSKRKGFGFIAGDDGIDYFCHFSAIESDAEIKYLSEGDIVEFSTEQTSKGWQASNVVKVLPKIRIGE